MTQPMFGRIVVESDEEVALGGGVEVMKLTHAIFVTLVLAIGAGVVAVSGASTAQASCERPCR